MFSDQFHLKQQAKPFTLHYEYMPEHPWEQPRYMFILYILS